MRVFVLVVLFFGFLFAKPPHASIKSSGNVMDLVFKKGLLYAATDNGFIDIYELNSTKLKQKIVFEKIKDFTKNLIGAKVYSIDVGKNGEILCVIQGKSFYRKLVLIQNGEVKILLNLNKKLMIKKAKFVSENEVLIALLSNEIILYDIKQNAFIYRRGLSHSQFSDFALNEQKNRLACSDESGNVSIIDVKSGKKLQVLSGANVDNVYKLDFKGGKILTAGQDRRGILYDLKKGNFHRFDASFLIYACALSKDAKFGALPINENNDIAIFNLKTKKQITLLKGQESTLNSIIFIDENTLVSGSDDKNIKIWRIK
ncbi:MAG: hypothetical protein CR967_02595 [Proteobacteria bacterium]|nr:MAG: hypothetical protein CR967_02595 [Pseudomonadota bacterium]